MTRNKPFRIQLVLALVVLAALVTTSCATSRYGRKAYRSYQRRPPVTGLAPRNFTRAPRGLKPAAKPIPPGRLKDGNPSMWISNHPRVAKFRAYYNRTITVERALEAGQRYLPTITRIFRERRLPLELAYLPMVESVFLNNADSGVARGLWQFTRTTARSMGLRVTRSRDERLNWYKATLAAADYLEILGRRFNYNWELALAAYNGGPGYMERAMKAQGTRNFYKLRLRKETYDYVPKFVAMVQVAKAKYTHMLVAGQ